MDSGDILNVECCVKDSQVSPAVLEQEIKNWLTDHYAALEINQCIHPTEHSAQLSDVQFLNVIDLVQKGDDLRTQASVSLAEVNVQLHIFQLHHLPRTDLEDDIDVHGGEPDGDEDAQSSGRLQAYVTLLPHAELHGLWETLVFDDPIQTRLLRFLLRIMSIAMCQLSSRVKCFNGLVLLYGPPGTGKSTLCRALAQKLAIRFREQFEQTKLIEFDAAALFSKFFGESSKLVSRMFARIERTLVEEPSVFLCVVVDEIESLAGTRQHLAGANEPKDSMRAVNALLLALDRLGRHSNVIVFCTTNLVQAIDPAVLDRIDVRQYIPGPSPRTRYEILRQCYLELLECNVVAPIQRRPRGEGENFRSSAADESLETWELLGQAGLGNSEALPSYEAMQVNFRAHKDSLPYRLWEIAEKSAGLSARVLQRLPVQALAMHIRFDPCSIEDAFEALSRMVEEQQLVLGS